MSFESAEPMVQQPRSPNAVPSQHSNSMRYSGCTLGLTRKTHISLTFAQSTPGSAEVASWP